MFMQKVYNNIKKLMFTKSTYTFKSMSVFKIPIFDINWYIVSKTLCKNNVRR